MCCSCLLCGWPRCISRAGFPPALGLVWCLGRVIYVWLYMSGKNRIVGFGLTIYSTLILVLLAIIGIVQAWMVA
jgi:hypothetical protein